MSAESILAVDDEEDILDLLRHSFANEGFNVTCALTGEKALQLTDKKWYDLILLDLMLPGMDGFEVAQSIKSDPRTQSIPIIMLTAKTSESDVVAGLELGADDYITKPFSPTIVVARAKAVLRQTVTDFSKKKGVLNLNNVYIDLRKHTVYAKGTPVNLTYTEFQVLSLLANRPGWAFSRSQIVNAIKGDNYLVTDRSVDVQIVGLRKKLGECGNIIETVRGVGYKLKDPYFP